MNAIDRFAMDAAAGLSAVSIKAGALLLAAWVVTLLMRKASGASRHLVWTLTVLGVLMFPALQQALPSWKVVVLPAPAVVAQRVTPPQDAPAKMSFTDQPYRDFQAGSLSLREPNDAANLHSTNAPALPRSETPMPVVVHHPIAAWLFLAWAIGAIGIGLFGIVGAVLVRRTGLAATVVREGALWLTLEAMRQQLGMRRRVQLLLGKSDAMPITWGILRPRILLPGDAINWTMDRTRSVLLHELAHVRRWDCATQLLAFFAVMVHWFNPLIWLAARRMRVERERACDDIVIGRGSSPTEYAEYLVLLARNLGAGSLQNVAAVAMARRSGLADRVKAILNANINRRELGYRAKLIAMVGVLVILVPLSAIHLMKKSGGSNAALAADATTQPTTMPVNVDANLPPLPERISSKQVPIRVLSAQGQPLRIDSIAVIEVWVKPRNLDIGPWRDSEDPPKILARYADGWVLVDHEMFALAQPGQRVDLIFSTNGTAMTVTGEYPKAASRKIVFTTVADPMETGIDTSAGPAAAAEEVAGEVVDPSGKPVEGAVVSFPEEPQSPRPPTTTDANGVFRFPGFGNQWYIYLQVEKKGYATRIITDVPVGHGFLVHMDNRTRLKGQLIAPDGSPASKATLEIVTSKPTTRERMSNPISDLTVSTTANEKGQYDIPLEPGQYKIRVSATNAGGYFDLSVPSGKTVALPGKLEAGITLKVVAIDTVTNKPASGVTLYLVNQRPGESSNIPGSNRTTVGDGVAQWINLTPGPAQLGVSSDAYGRWWTDEMAKQGWMRGIDDVPVELSQGMPVVTIHMEPAVQVSGQVLSPSGESVADAAVDIAGMWTGDSRYSRRTDAKGNFKLVFPVLRDDSGHGAAAKYAIVASDPQHRWANATGDWFTAAVGQKLTFTLKMTAGARLRGKVVTADGKPVANLEVQGQAGDALDRSYYNPRALTDDGGHFELGPMRASRYSIYLNASQGEVTSRSDSAPTITIAEGDRIDVGDMRYAGPAPSAVPNWYASAYGPPIKSPTTQGDEASWRHVKLGTFQAAVDKAIQQQIQRMERGETPAEQELPGTPAKPGQLSGKVVDDKGNPIPDVAIKIWTWEPGNRQTTDKAGEFSLTKLETDQKVEIRFSKEGYCPKYIPQQPTGLSDLVVVMTNKTYFEGQVKGPDGAPVAGAKIRADQGPKRCDGCTVTNVWTETVTDDKGNYRLYVDPDAYDIQLRVPGVGVARPGKMPIGDGQVKHLDIALTTGIPFHAKVVDSITGEPVKGVRLWSWQHEGVEGRSDASGNLLVEFMTPGRFDFNVEAKGYTRWWSEQSVSEWNHHQFIERAGKWERNFDSLDFDMATQMPPITITVERSVTIRGTVLDPDGQPVNGATVAPALTGTGNSLTGDTRFSVVSKAGGEFEMELPASGDHDYNLMVHDGKYGQWRKWANGVLPPIRNKPGDQLNDITLTLTRPVVVRGRVLDADGNPVANREVRTVGGDLLENRYYDPTVKTDKNGDFTLKFVRPGQLIIQVAPFWLTPSEALAGSSRTVTLIEGQNLDGVSLTTTPD